MSCEIPIKKVKNYSKSLLSTLSVQISCWPLNPEFCALRTTKSGVLHGTSIPYQCTKCSRRSILSQRAGPARARPVQVQLTFWIAILADSSNSEWHVRKQCYKSDYPYHGICEGNKTRTGALISTRWLLQQNCACIHNRLHTLSLDRTMDSNS